MRLRTRHIPAICFLLGMLTCLVACQPEPPPAHLFEEDGYTSVNGTELYYKILGDGEPIVVVHGGPGMDHTYFLPQFEALAHHHRLIFYDQRVSGRSTGDVDSSTINIQHFIDDLDGIRETFGLDQMHLLGHSWGGLVAMYYATTYPERVQSLLLVNTTAASASLMQAAGPSLMSRMTPEDSLARATAMASEALQNGLPEGYAALYRANFRLSFFDRSLADSLTLTFQPDFATKNALLRHLAPGMENYDLHPQLSQITSPTRIIHTDYDGTPVESIARIQQALPNAELIVLERCGHFPFIECPTPFFDAVRRFIDDHTTNL